MDPPRVIEQAAALETWMLAKLERLTSLDGPSGDPAILDASATYVEECLAELGAKTVRHPSPAGDHLEARLGSTGAACALVLTHYDTVWPAGTARVRPYQRDGDTVSGAGVYDMRGGLVAALAALALLAELGCDHRPVLFLATADEERGSRTSRALIERAGRSAAYALVPEPPLPGGGLKTSRQGVATYRLRTTGRSAHAGIDPGAGVNAIDALIEAVNALRKSSSGLQGLSVNVGVIGGGTQANVIPDSAWAEVDVRAWSAPAMSAAAAVLTALAEERELLEIDTLDERPVMERSELSAALFERACDVAGAAGIALEEGASGGGSDGNYVASLGIPVLDGLGPDGGGAHALDERILVPSLMERAGLMALLIAGL